MASQLAVPSDVPSPRTVRQRVHAMVEADVAGGERYDVAIISLICLNVLAMVLETVKPLHAAYGDVFYGLEVLSVAVFSVDYGLRMWSCVERPEYAGAVAGRVRYALTPMALIHLVSVLPFFLPFLGVDLRFVRALNVLRLLRLAKLARYSRALRMVGRVLSGKREELATTISLVGVLLLVASSLMYFAERGAQPDKFSSIPEAMWWGIVTLTTVGYGDVFPVTSLGKALSAVIALLGVGVVALPTGILGAAFVEEMAASRTRPTVVVLCSRCGEQVDGEGHHGEG